jgi:hypothetical protein
MKILVVGAGPIGARHLRDLRVRDLCVCDTDTASRRLGGGILMPAGVAR